ncbi:MAG: NAD(P)H-dependent oxidoreductase [Desulfobulbaceae bacterium]|nr:NAD(P)H-dependent oxidoreductase [Desulfobulbaceae bacterium]
MKIFAVNGSPRKDWNTASLLKNMLEGAARRGAETELIHLYDLDYKGCRSCFACKRVGTAGYGRCAVKDDLSPLLAAMTEGADALIVGSPIYFGMISGETQSFLERLLFPNLVYSAPPSSLFPRQIASVSLFTMNVTEELSREMGYPANFARQSEFMERILGGPARIFACYDTCQFADYSKVIMEMMDPARKIQRHQDVFPEECRRAAAMGEALAGRKTP